MPWAAMAWISWPAIDWVCVLAAFVLLHLYMVARESIMGRTTMISAMVNGHRMVRGNPLSVRQYEKKAKTGNLS